eukprot:365531-Chlamydomonas_euryale.AAC.11
MSDPWIRNASRGFDPYAAVSAWQEGLHPYWVLSSHLATRATSCVIRQCQKRRPHINTPRSRVLGSVHVRCDGSSAICDTTELEGVCVEPEASYIVQRARESQKVLVWNLRRHTSCNAHVRRDGSSAICDTTEPEGVCVEPEASYIVQRTREARRLQRHAHRAKQNSTSSAASPSAASPPAPVPPHMSASTCASSSTNVDHFDKAARGTGAHAEAFAPWLQSSRSGFQEGCLASLGASRHSRVLPGHSDASCRLAADAGDLVPASAAAVAAAAGDDVADAVGAADAGAGPAAAVAAVAAVAAAAAALASWAAAAAPNAAAVGSTAPGAAAAA